MEQDYKEIANMDTIHEQLPVKFNSTHFYYIIARKSKNGRQLFFCSKNALEPQAPTVPSSTQIGLLDLGREMGMFGNECNGNFWFYVVLTIIMQLCLFIM